MDNVEGSPQSSCAISFFNKSLDQSLRTLLCIKTVNIYKDKKIGKTYSSVIVEIILRVKPVLPTLDSKCRDKEQKVLKCNSSVTVKVGTKAVLTLKAYYLGEV